MATLMAEDHKVYATIPIHKWVEDKDGNLLVYGKATDGSVDFDQQIVDPDWSASALKRWLHTGGNVRVQHNPALYPAGTGLSVEVDKDGDSGHWVKSLIVEPTAKSLVRHGVLRAYSIGIARPVVTPDVTGKARGGIISGDDSTEIYEISLVDRPANQNCSISLVKSEGQPDPWSHGDLLAIVAKAESGEYEQARDVWLSREPRYGADGTAFLSQHAAWRQEGDLEGLSTPEGRPRWLAKAIDPDVGGGVDRDTLKDGDFVFPDERKFPVVTPADVSDAVSSWGRYKGSKSFAEFQAKLTALCRRKGASFLAKLPASWHVTKGMDMAETITLVAPEDGEGVDKAAKKPKKDDDATVDSGGDGDAEADSAEAEDPDAKCKAAEPDAVEKAKNCPGCSAEYHNDSKLRRCSECGAKLPHGGDKSADDEDTATKSVPTIPGPGPLSPGMHREPDGHTVEELESDAGMSEPGEHEAPDQIPASALKGHLQAAHDALIASCPDLCSVAVKVLAESIEPVVTPVRVPEVAKALTPTTPLVTLDDVSLIVKTAVAEVAATYTAQLEKLRAELDELGAQPDPAQAPLRGVVAKAVDLIAPVERVSLAAQQAETQKTEYADWLRHVADEHSDPTMRKQAAVALRRLL